MLWISAGKICLSVQCMILLFDGAKWSTWYSWLVWLQKVHMNECTRECVLHNGCTFLGMLISLVSWSVVRWGVDVPNCVMFNQLLSPGKKYPHLVHYQNKDEEDLQDGTIHHEYYRQSSVVIHMTYDDVLKSVGLCTLHDHIPHATSDVNDSSGVRAIAVSTEYLNWF